MFAYLVLIGVGQGFGSFSFVRQLDIEAQDVALAVAIGVVLPDGLVEASALLATPGVAELVITKRSLQVS